MKKYNISKEIKILKLFRFSIYKWIIPIYNIFITIISNNKHSNKDIIVKRISVNSFDNYKIKVYEFVPRKNTNTKRAMVYFHGGAFYLKPTFYHYSLAKKYALLSDMKVFFVEYRLSPKYRYPIGVLDSFSVYSWILENANELGVDPSCLGIGGDSAGGSIALNLASLLKEKEMELPKFQLLIYPVVDNKIKTKSKDIYTNTPMWNSKLNEKMWKYYLDDETVYNSPFNSVNNIKTYIEVSEYDCLRDEGIEYYKYLKKNNIEAYLNETKGTVHGYDILLNKSIVKENIMKRIAFLCDIGEEK